jgi:hypothetical protein
MTPKQIAAVLVLGLAAGCATHGPLQGRSGNYVDALSFAYSDQMADDAVKQLCALYPPANTRLVLKRESSDPFGAALTMKLRERGYAVVEPLPEPRQAQAGSAETTPSAPETELSYVVDRLGASEYLVIVQVGGQSISRVYRPEADGLAPVGYWARKE